MAYIGGAVGQSIDPFVEDGGEAGSEQMALLMRLYMVRSGFR
jgi:hypothetical protein